MYDEGYVNDQFWQIQQMKKTTQPDYAVRAVTSYCMSAQNLFTQLTDHINQENVDFHQVNVSARELFEQSNSCSKTLYWTKNEFSQLKRKFETVVQSSSKAWVINFISDSGRVMFSNFDLELVQIIVLIASLWIAFCYLCDITLLSYRSWHWDQIPGTNSATSVTSLFIRFCSNFLLGLNCFIIANEFNNLAIRRGQACEKTKNALLLNLLQQFSMRSSLKAYVFLQLPLLIITMRFLGLLTPCSIEMALSILKGLLQGYVQSLFDEGIVNDQFSQIHTLKSEEEPEHVVQLIDKYFVEVETILSELTSKIDCPDVDFSKLSELAHKVDERSLSIGARHVKLACADLIKSCDQMNKENFSRALIWIKNEFSHTRNKLEAYAQKTWLVGKKMKVADMTTGEARTIYGSICGLDDFQFRDKGAHGCTNVYLGLSVLVKKKMQIRKM
ncbi:histidine-containing phosphotransfer protein 5 [Quercus suber]|uniref:Histidine-containing phosphotransfer protein n=1 Tax=Quercus suber TaxID=58331 RepID=A0AAW0L1K6_QUESU